MCNGVIIDPLELMPAFPPGTHFLRTLLHLGRWANWKSLGLYMQNDVVICQANQARSDIHIEQTNAYAVTI